MLFVSFVIGQCDNFGFGYTTLNRKLLCVVLTHLTYLAIFDLLGDVPLQLLMALLS